MTDPIDTWVAELAAALGIGEQVPAAAERDLLLDLARDAAHGIARPAAPLTTYLVGLAAGLGGGGSDAMRAAAVTAARLAVARERD